MKPYLTVDFLVMVDRLSLISWSRIVTAVESRALPDHKDNGWIHIYIYSYKRIADGSCLSP